MDEGRAAILSDMETYRHLHRGRRTLAFRAHNAGLTQEAIAKRMGVNIKTVERWIKDARTSYTYRARGTQSHRNKP